MDALSLITDGLITPIGGEITVVALQIPFNLTITPEKLKVVVREPDKLETAISDQQKLEVTVMEPDKITVTTED